MDYHEGMLGLMSEKLYGSAFALQRPTVEALIRAHIVRQFPQADVDRIKADTYMTNFKTIGPEIDAAFGYPDIFTRLLKDKNILHSFTHSGMLQLGRRFKGNDLDVNFEPEDIINFANISTACMALVTIMVASQFGLMIEAEQANRLLTEWCKPNAGAAS